LRIREIADELNLSFGTCQAILTQDLGMRCVSAKLVSRLLTQDQTQHSIPVVPHPPYSPDLAPCDFFLFPSTLKGKRFQDVAEIKLNTTRQLQAIPKQAYQRCIKKWKDFWNRVIQSGWSYFEGDNFE
jgi:hypothetical protein